MNWYKTTLTNASGQRLLHEVKAKDAAGAIAKSIRLAHAHDREQAVIAIDIQLYGPGRMYDVRGARLDAFNESRTVLAG